MYLVYRASRWRLHIIADDIVLFANPWPIAAEMVENVPIISSVDAR